VIVFVISLVFLAVITGFFAPAENPPIVYPAIDMSCAAIFCIETVARFWALNNPYGFFTNLFCVTDFLCVLLDVLTYGGILRANGTKLIRTVRLLRLLRLAKLMRLLKKLRDELTRDREVPPWKLPEEYLLTPGKNEDLDDGEKLMKLKAMKAMATVVKYTIAIEGQYKLQSLLRVLGQHFRSPGSQGSVPSSSRSTKPQQLGHDLFLEADAAELPDGCIEIETKLHGDELLTTVLHLIMYEYAPLAQAGIDLLMTIYMARDTLVTDLTNAQLLETPDDEGLYAQIRDAVWRISRSLGRFDLEAAIDTSHFELLTASFDTCIKGSCREDPSWQVGGRWTLPVPGAQVMLRNLAFDAAFKEWRNDLEYPHDSDLGEIADRRREVYRLMNQLAACFLQSCPVNQQMFSALLPELMQDVKRGVVGSAGVIFELLLNNNELVGQLPNDFNENMLSIAAEQQSATVLQAVKATLTVGGIPNEKAQIEVMKHLTDNEGTPHADGTDGSRTKLGKAFEWLITEAKGLRSLTSMNCSTARYSAGGHAYVAVGLGLCWNFFSFLTLLISQGFVRPIRPEQADGLPYRHARFIGQRERQAAVSAQHHGGCGCVHRGHGEHRRGGHPERDQPLRDANGDARRDAATSDTLSGCAPVLRGSDLGADPRRWPICEGFKSLDMASVVPS
jgi:hypothetical protein